MDVNLLSNELIIKLIMLHNNCILSDYPIIKDATYIELEDKGYICNLKSGFPSFTQKGKEIFEDYYKHIEEKILEHYDPQQDYMMNSYYISQKTGIEESIVYNFLVNKIKY